MRKENSARQWKAIIILTMILILCSFLWVLTGNNVSDVMIEEKLWENPGTMVISEGSPQSFGAKLQALSACVMDAENCRVLYGKEENTVRKMASTTKIMTCILALELGNLSDIVTVSSYAASMPDVQLNIRQGEQYRLGDLLYSMMLESHNDSAVAVAEHIGGSEEEFCKMMTQKAKDLGAVHTSFQTANGLDKENHYTTAADMGRIAAYAVKNPLFLEIVGTQTKQISEVNGKRSFFLKNIDRYLYMDKDALGIKTGFTGEAGYCFVGATRFQNTILITVVLGSGWPPHKEYKWSDTKSLVSYVRKAYDTKVFEFSPENLGNLCVNGGRKPQVRIGISEGWSEEMIAQEETYAVTYLIPKSVCAPVEMGSTIGYALLTVGEDVVKVLPVTALEDVPQYEMTEVWEKITGFLFF